MKDIFKKQMDTEIGQVGVRNRIDCRLLRRDMQRTIPTTRIQSLFCFVDSLHILPALFGP